jgi:hypothetical protein
VSWEAIGAIGQLLGAFALILVLVQVRQAREEMRRSLHASRSDILRQLHLARATDPELTSLVQRAEDGLGHTHPTQGFVAQLVERAGLTRAEANRVLSEQMAFWQYRQQQIRHIAELDAGARFEIDGTIRLAYGPGGISAVSRLWYETLRPILNPDTVRYVDSVLARAERPS